jgi:hypothetical protein
MTGIEQALTTPASQNQSGIRWATSIALGGSLLLCILATFRGGYIGPDYYTHLMRFIDWRQVFDFSTTNPPFYFLIGWGLWKVIGSNLAFLFTVSILQASINTIAIYWFLIYCEGRFSSRIIHFSLGLFLAFLPVRMIHSATLGTDCTTIPVFVLILFCLDKLLAEGGLTVKNASALGVSLALAIGLKYTFMALLPALALVFVILALKRKWGFQRFVTISLVSLLLATLFTLASFWLSSRVHGYNTERHWKPPNPANVRDMSFVDLFSFKKDDAHLFSAPQAFKEYLTPPHAHGYFPLSHFGIFTDPMSLFQQLKIKQVFGGVIIPDQHERAPWKTPVMVASIWLGIIWTLLALVGTFWSLARAGQNLARGKLEREDSTVIMGTAFFLLIFLAIPFVFGAALFGYWTPRLILPSILSSSLAAFLFVDKVLVRGSKVTEFTVLFLVSIQCLVEIVMLA